MRPIDADAWFERIDADHCASCRRLPCPCSKCGIGIARESIENTPTLDAVPVIRCTKCEYYGPGDHAGFWRCENWGVDINSQASPPETFYCADGQPKEEET